MCFLWGKIKNLSRTNSIMHYLPSGVGNFISLLLVVPVKCSAVLGALLPAFFE